MPFRILSRHSLLLGLLAALSGCAVTPAPTSAQPAVATTEPDALAREQLDPPAPRLEHPGKPAASGQVWLPGRWDRVGTRYLWRNGQWSAPKPGFLWQPHGWRRQGKPLAWVQHGGQWVPDANKPPGWYKPRR